MKKPLMIFILGIAIGSLFTSMFWRSKLIQQKPQTIYGFEVGNQLENFTLETTDATSFSLEDVKGKPVLLNFFASWCSYCQQEALYLQEIKEAYPNVAIVMVNLSVLEETVEDVYTFEKELGLTLPILLDDKGSMIGNFRIQGTPYNVFLDGNHGIRSIVPGAMNYEMLQAQLNLLQ